MMYEAAELPALRWVASGQLGPDQVYLISVHDVTANLTYSGMTRDLSFQVPLEWQPSDGKTHTFQWSVSIATKNSLGTPLPSKLTTAVRSFTWHSR
jgi:hypothetical protein